MNTLYRPLLANVVPMQLPSAAQLESMIATSRIPVKASDVTFVEGIHAAAGYSCNVQPVFFDDIRNAVARGDDAPARGLLAVAATRLGDLSESKFASCMEDVQRRMWDVTGGRPGLERKDVRRDIDPGEEAILSKVVQGEVKWSSGDVSGGKENEFEGRAADLTGRFEASLRREDNAWRRGLPPFVFLAREDLLRIAQPYLMGRLVAVQDMFTTSSGTGGLVGKTLAYGAGKVVDVEQRRANAGPFLMLKILSLDGKETEYMVSYPDQVWCFQPAEESDRWPHVAALTEQEIRLAGVVQKDREVRHVAWDEILGPDAKGINRALAMNALTDYGDRLKGPMHNELASVLVASGLSVFGLPHEYAFNRFTGPRENFDDLTERFIVGSNVYWQSWGKDPELAFERFAGRVLQANVYNLGREVPHYSVQLYLMTADRGVVRLMMDPSDFEKSTFVLVRGGRRP